LENPPRPKKAWGNVFEKAARRGDEVKRKENKSWGGSYSQGQKGDYIQKGGTSRPRSKLDGVQIKQL